jgi:pilus assembly protein Flp/PilA
MALSRRRPAQGLVEYLLVLALVALLCVVVMTFMGKTVTNVFSNLTTTFVPTAPASACVQHAQDPSHCQH